MKSHLLYKKLISAALASAALLGGNQAFAQSAPEAEGSPADPQTGPAPEGATASDDKRDVIVVTGTRTTGLTAADSPAPIQVVDLGSLESTGQPDLRIALAQNVPSFVAQSFGGDAAALTLSAKLRGVSPNHALVLVNGKRRHGTSNLAVLGGAFQGNAGADLSFIPTGSIDHVEVLLDGAAAQYGTDAIAGVINIFQKTDGSGGSVAVDSGQYFDGGGESYHVSANTGWTPWEGAFVNFTYDTKFRDDSFRGDFDPRVVDGPWNSGATNSPARSYPQVVTNPQWPYVNRIAGDPQIKVDVGSFNAGWDITEALQFYAFGSYGWKKGEAHENFRLPNVVTGKAVDGAGNRTDIPFPLGFDPREGSEEQDYSVAAGFTGDVGGLRWDFGSVYGEDKVKLTVINTANADLYRDTSVLATATTAYKPGFSPHDIYAGAFNSRQWTTTFDATYPIDVGFAEPITIAAGAEYRIDGYKLSAGNPATYYKGGSQSYYGFAPTDASDNERDSWAIYAEADTKPFEALTLDVAVRHEDYSDFGDTTIGKLTARYDLNDAIAFRGTISNGFRAPTLAEGFYSGINVSPSTISGQLAPNSPGAALLGSNGLEPEESKNYSLGFVAHPASNLTVTFDAYQIDIDNRIIGSSSLTGDSSSNVTKLPRVVDAIAANGVIIDQSIKTNASWSIGASFFTNGVNTETRGADLVVTYNTDFGDFGSVDWTASGNYTEQHVTYVAPPKAELVAGAFIPPGGTLPSLFDSITRYNFENSSPTFRFHLAAKWEIGKFTVSVTETINGPARSIARSPQTQTFYATELDTTPITDLEIAYEISDSLKFAIGADNLFNEYPGMVPDFVRQEQLNLNSNAYVTKYSSLSPYGINGGYYYGRLTYSF